jgi:uncharacterized protein
MKCVIRTFSGRVVNPLDLRIDDIVAIDVAHALANISRFNGHTREPISVAQHSVFVSLLCEPYGVVPALQGLFHDGSEYALGDVTKWLKHSDAMIAYREAESRAQDTVFRAFNLPTELHPSVEMADRLMVRYEGLQGFGASFIIEHPNYPPLTAEELEQVDDLGWRFWSWKKSRMIFMERYHQLAVEREQLEGAAKI